MQDKNNPRILNNVEIEGKQYALIERKEGTYVDGFYVKYLLVSLASINSLPAEHNVRIDENT